MDNYDEVEEIILIPNQMYGVHGKGAELPEAAGIHWLGRGITCVSLKSLTPTQYTMAPRDLAFSACWKKNKEWIYYSWNTGGLKLRTQWQRQWSVERLPLAAR